MAKIKQTERISHLLFNLRLAQPNYLYSKLLASNSKLTNEQKKDQHHEIKQKNRKRNKKVIPTKMAEDYCF